MAAPDAATDAAKPDVRTEVEEVLPPGIACRFEAEQSEVDVLDPAKDIKFIGIDVDDSSCHIFAADEGGRCVLRRRVPRAALLMDIPIAAGAVVGLEYRSDLHGLASCLADMGLEIRLIRARTILPSEAAEGCGAFVCAEALCEAVRGGSAEAVPILDPDQQGRAASQRVKALLKRQRSAVLNSARNVIGGVDAGQRPTSRDDVEIMRRLGSIAETSAFHPVFSALSQVLSSLESTIAMLDGVPSRIGTQDQGPLRETGSGPTVPGHAELRLARAGLATGLGG